MTTITTHTTKDIEQLKSRLAKHLKSVDPKAETLMGLPVVKTDLFPNMTDDERKRLTTAEWVDLPREPEPIRQSFHQHWVTRELLEDSRVSIESIFSYQCRCILLGDDTEPRFGTPEYDEWERRENQKAMDAFWSERPTR